MSHVDEGALHAYLDGALDEYPATEARRIRDHLDACSACAERLEAERGLRSDAHAMLGLAAPAVDMPSFEELRAYVERTRPATSRTTVRVTRLSWAASVMLALGVGWILRGGRMEPPADRTSAAPIAAAEVERSVSAGPAQSIESSAFESRTDLPATAVAAVDEAEVALDKIGAERSELEAPVAVLATEASTSAVVASGSEVSRVAGDPSLEEDESIRASRSQGGAEPTGETALDAAMSDRAIEAPVSTIAVDDAPDFLASTSVVAAADPVEEESARPERRRSESPTAFTSQFNAGRGGVRVVPEDDDRFDDEPLQSVPGFEVVATENIGDGLEFVGTVTTQRLEGEDMMQAFLLEPEIELDVLPVLDPGLNEVRVETETGWVVLRGPRSEDELETLLMRLFPG
ncbi:MAG: hypothetical protein OXU33_04760 [Gemmatimonadota bacterium]|nr:hypothetical protein [Gemmatimonadota bacterium]MDE3013362.1 hypothetical protein [Gemmatimonadota bacterium]